MPPKSSFLDKVLGRIGRLDAEGLQTVVQRLARERGFLETLFNTIEDGVLVVDEAGRILYFNQAVTRFLGLQPQVEGQPVVKFIPGLDWEKISQIDAAGGPGVVRHEFEVHYPRPRFLRLYAAPLDGQARGSAGVALILHDATEARQQTFEAIESERIQALTLLAASVAHEIGNPLNALHIHLQLMEREVKKLASASGTTGRLPFATRGRLRSQVITNKDEMATPAEGSGPAGRWQTAGGGNETAEGPQGVWVSVADTGGGIPQEQINRIFDPFFTTKKKGTGLGLMIVQRIVRAHGGRIELESQVGRGTVFRVWLPLHERRPRLLEAPMHD